MPGGFRSSMRQVEMHVPTAACPWCSTPAWRCPPPAAPVPALVGRGRAGRRRLGALVLRAAATDESTATLLRNALSGRQAELEGSYSAGSAFLQSHLGIQSVGERSRILDTAMNPNSMYALRPNGKGIVNAWARKATVEEMRAVVDFLQGRGLTIEQVQKVVSEHPPTLVYDPDTRLAPLFDYLAELGMTPGATVVRRPSLLGLDADANLRRIVGYLQEVDGRSLAEIEELLATTL